MMLGLLLARAGARVIVLEKHADFLRDFRGDTLHPSTLEALHDLGYLEELLKRPHQKASHLRGVIGDRAVTVADFSALPVHAPYIAFMPQWDFLAFLAEKARAYPTFQLRMEAEVRGLVIDAGRVTGVEVKTPDGEFVVSSRLVVGADGRGSRVREAAGLRVRDYGAPIDVLWFRLPRLAGDTGETLGRFEPGSLMILINRETYWQCGYVIPKGEFEEIRRDGLDALRERIARTTPFLKDGLHELADWDRIKLLTVKVDRLERWYRDGLLCIGDAAHAMSPVGGVGINFAVQDAIATARIVAGPLRLGTLTTSDLAQVEKRRAWPAALMQRLQIFIHRHVIYHVLKKDREKPLSLPWPLRLLDAFPLLRRLPGRLIGMGFRPERIDG